MSDCNECPVSAIDVTATDAACCGCSPQGICKTPAWPSAMRPHLLTEDYDPIITSPELDVIYTD
jgi:hypothetical protein